MSLKKLKLVALKYFIASNKPYLVVALALMKSNAETQAFSLANMLSLQNVPTFDFISNGPLTKLFFEILPVFLKMSSKCTLTVSTVFHLS